MELYKDQEFANNYKSMQNIQMDISDEDKAMIIHMLRNSTYSNKIESLVREVLSNGIDAHTRAGKEKTPLLITVPGGDSKFFICRDYGNSMTPTVIEKVYSRLGSSDKKSSNKELGGLKNIP